MIAGPAGGRSPPTRCPARRKGDSRRITVQQGKRRWLAVLSVGCETVSDWRSGRCDRRASARERLPLGQRGRAAKLVGLAIDEMAFLGKVVVD